MTVQVFVSGFVQGIGYRQFVKKNANELGVTGYARNLPDGRVEAKFSGDKKKIEKLISLCKKGPFLSEVENVEVNSVPQEIFDSFEVIP